MGVGYIILPFLILIFYIIPFGLFFIKRINKGIRISLLSIPLLLTIVFITYAVIDDNKSNELYRKFPQANNITFLNSAKDVRDSIIQLQKIMEKLPKRSDHESVSYSLDKHPQRYYSFSFNWFDLDNLRNLEKSNNLHDFKITESISNEWTKYVSSDLFPFDTLTQSETKRFINLIKYLDRNSLSAANLENNIIAFDYNDSLRMSDNLGFRKITLDTSGYYGSDFFDIIDKQNGLYLLRKK